MIQLDMQSKREVRITNKAFHLENNVLKLPIELLNYDLAGKTITAVFEPSRVETGVLEVIDGAIQIPIYSSVVRVGVNSIQLNFRWDANKLEQSGKLMWVIDKSLETEGAAQEDVDIISYLINEIQAAKATADRMIEDAGDVRIELDESTASATAINNTLADPVTGTIKLATDANATLSQSIIDAGVADGALTDPVTGAIVLAEAAEDALTNPITGAIKLAEDAEDALTNPTTGTIKQASDKNTELEGTILEADRVVDEAGDVRVELEASVSDAEDINFLLSDPVGGTIKLADDMNTELEGTIVDAQTAKSDLDDPLTGAITLAREVEDDLINPTTGAIKLAEDAKGDIEQAIVDNEIVTQAEFTAHKEDYTQLNADNRLTILEEAKIKKYGVKFTGSNPVGERTDDAVGMVANVGVDAQVVLNDFDKVSFFDRKITNGYHDANGKYIVMAYRGEPGFDFEGGIFAPYANKSEVYYECTPCGWNGSYDEPSVTGTPIEGYELFEFFDDWHTKKYLPTFWMADVDGKPTSRSGLLPGYYSLNSAMVSARNYHAKAHTETMAAHMYEYVLQLVEFATRDVQLVMMGCSNLRYNSAVDVAVIGEIGVNRIVLTNANANNYVVGQTIVIGTSQNGTNVAGERSITSIETYDASNMAINFDGAPVNIGIGNFVSSRVWKNGATDIVVASSGSPVSNSSGKYPCIWRGKVDPWAEGFSAICDHLIKRYGAGTPEEPYRYRGFFLQDPTKYANGVITDDYIELQYDLPTTDGYAKVLGQDSRYRFSGLTKETGAASTTYLSAYYYYPRYDICVVFVGGLFFHGRPCSPVYFYLGYLPSYSSFFRLSRLLVS